MPTYEYVCTACDNEWEEVQRISEDALELCPKCGKSTAKRQISAGNFILKGGGWYADAYSSAPKAKGGEGSSEGKSESKSEGKAEGAAGATAPAKSDGGSAGAATGSGSGTGTGTGTGTSSPAPASPPGGGSKGSGSST